MPSILNSDDGVVSGTSGLKTTGGNDGITTFQQNGTERMRIDSSGNVGVGTSSPNIYSGGTYKRITLSDSASSGYGILTVAGGSGGGGEIDFGNQTIRQAAIATLDGSILGFYTNATNSGVNLSERMRIDSSGRVGIGATPASWNTGWKVQQIGVGSFADALSSGAGNIIISSNYYDDGTNSRYINTGAASLYQSYNGAHTFYTAPSGSAGAVMTPTVRVRINEYGIGVGDTTPTSGMGITFPATISASSNANTLDDYEEGTWQVSVIGASTAGTTTYGTERSGWYRKIGSQVTVWYYVNVLSSTGSGPMLIGPLPFGANTSNIQSAGSIMTNNLNWGVTTASIVSYLGTNQQYLYMYFSSDDAGWAAQSIINEQFDLIGTHTYFTND